MSAILPRLMTSDEARDCLDEIRIGTLKVKERLIELHERRGWEVLGYASWRACVTTELQIGKSQAYRLLDAAYISQEISPIGENVTESQARELKKAPKEKRAETLEKAKETAAAQGRDKPTAKDIRDAVEQGSGKTPPHDATQQEAEGPRRAVTDGDEGPCPKGGEHDIFTLHGGRYCGRCKAQFPADDGDDAEIVEGQVAFDFAGMRDTCQWWIDNCPGDYLVALAAEFDAWAKQVRGRL